MVSQVCLSLPVYAHAHWYTWADYALGDWINGSFYLCLNLISL